MLVYLPTAMDRASNTMFITPGALPGGVLVSEWFNEAREPIMFVVEFKNGVADVASNLGRLMVDQGLAADSPIIVVSAEA